MSDSYTLDRIKIKSAQIPHFLNWLYFEDEFVMTKNSLLLSFYEVEPHSDYYNPSDDIEAVEAMNRFTMGLEDGMALWYEWRKYPENFKDIFSDQTPSENEYIHKFDEMRKETLSSSISYKARRFITIAFSPSITGEGVQSESIVYFKKFLTDMESRFKSAKISIRKLNKDEICTYLHSTISTKQYKILTPSAATNALSDALWDDDLDPTYIPLRLGDEYIKIVTIDDFPSEGTTPELLADITKISGDIRWVTRWVGMGEEKAKSEIDKKRRRYFSKRYSGRDIVAHALFKSDISMVDEQALSRSEECSQAMSLIGEYADFGYYTATFICKGKSERECDALSKKVQEILAKRHFIYREEKLNLLASWIGSIPGNLESNPRRQFISTGNLSCLLSLTTPYTGEERNEFLGKISGSYSPNAIGRLTTGEPYYLNLNGKGDLGHTLVVGPSGAGKSILLSFLASSWAKYPNSRIIFFDKDLSSKTLVEGTGGKILIPGKDETTFLPLGGTNKNDTESMERAMNFIESIAVVNGITLHPQDIERIQTVFTLLTPRHESIAEFRSMLSGEDHNSDLVSALSQYSQGGTFGHLFDSEVETLDLKSLPLMTTIEMGYLLDLTDKAIIPALTYLFSKIKELVKDGRPTLLIFDEAWIFLKNDFVREFLVECLKTLRKRNTFMVMATQEITDYSSIMESVLTNTHTTILLPNGRANTEGMVEIYHRLGVQNNDIARITSKELEQKKHYYIIQSEGKAIVDFALSKEELQMIGGR